MVEFGGWNPGDGAMAGFAIIAASDMPGAFAGCRNAIMTANAGGIADGRMIEYRRA